MHLVPRRQKPGEVLPAVSVEVEAVVEVDFRVVMQVGSYASYLLAMMERK